ncbi:RDD family protein [Haloechinothrix sp. YIM 98757]|uniref:RDD family protein n=1 Tax=Haloechinothrix aidingensis TaxID=2752311 RepID=A0A838ACQ8_9PSEU|nr:RDD family protein [Haloechinothrix aidingensis]
MARWTGTWLSGPGTLPGAAGGTGPRWPGERLGLPERGVGAVAGGGRRVAGLLLDWLAAGLIASLFVPPPLYDVAAAQAQTVGYEYQVAAVLLWFVLTVPSAALFGFTPGMAAAGIRVGRLDGASRVGAWRAVVRWALTFLLIPPAIRNVDGRGLHDRTTDTVVVRMR